MSVLSDAIKENINLLDYAREIGFTPIQKGNNWFLKEVDSLHINPLENVYFRHSTEKGGSIIDFAMEFQNLSLSEAMSKLRGRLNPRDTNLHDYKNQFSGIAKTPVPTEFVLPPKFEGRYNRLFSYLNKTRGIDSNVISDMVKRDMLYEDSKYHNAVFVGFDYEGTARYASKRSTISNPTSESFTKSDVAGSSKKVGFFVDNKKPSLFICEAPIDALSIMSVLKIHEVDYNKYNYLALGGVSLKGIDYHLQQNPNIKRIYLAFDNDDVGNAARVKAREFLSSFQGEIIDKPPHNKDFNEDLKIIYNKTNAISNNKEIEKCLER